MAPFGTPTPAVRRAPAVRLFSRVSGRFRGGSRSKGRGETWESGSTPSYGPVRREETGPRIHRTCGTHVRLDPPQSGLQANAYGLDPTGPLRRIVSALSNRTRNPKML